MELITRSKRPGMNCSIDVFFERGDGFSEYLHDSMTYKMILVEAGTFVVEENGKYRVFSAPVGIVLDEEDEFNVVSESGVKSMTIYFKPTIIREEFTIEAIRSGKYDRFFSTVSGQDQLSAVEKVKLAIDGDVSFDDCFCRNMIYQDAVLLLFFSWRDYNDRYYSLTKQELDSLKRMFFSIAYELREQPDNFWIVRIRYFITSILFLGTVDFYRNFRQDEIYEDPLVAQVTRYFWENLNEDITLNDVLKRFSVNKNILNDAFNKEVSMSCMAYLELLRINLAKRILQFGDETVSEISVICGYSDTNYFTKVFKKHTGMTPSAFRKLTKEKT